jgi:UDP-N-acetylmuramoyl-L-alanyl-D-glutamate--2,6-diaminopimelate ligase
VLDYAHTPDALARVLQSARSLARDRRVIAVFGAGGSKDPTKREPMGEAVGQRVDLAFVTNDNPRREDPAVIARAVAAGCTRGGRAETRVIYDRSEAIGAAISAARPGDVVVVAGRGHDRGMTFANGVIEYCDVDAVRAALGG